MLSFLNNITVVGHGYVGQAVAEELLRRKISFWDHYTHEKPPVDVRGTIINCAGFVGRPNVEACEQTKVACLEGNVFFPLRLEAQNPNARVIHVGSGCIYQGGPFHEEQPPNFTLDDGGSFYSGTKALFESKFNRERNYLLRIRMPFDGNPQLNPRSLLSKIIAYPKLVDHVNSITALADVARVAVNFAKDHPAPGVYNVVNTGWITTREINGLLWKHWETAGRTYPKKRWVTRETFERMVKTPRSECKLLNDKLTRLYPIDDVRTAVEKAIRTL